ncbi:DsbA family protein [Enterobacter hormaechei]|uniref:DsbA family protein n=1 Tax=Enterobacter hormaechei TaxID=158836 RepID=UPI003D17DB65
MKKGFIAGIALLVLVVAAFGLWLTAKPAEGNRDSFVASHSPVLGVINAPVTIVEFFDPACEACAAMYAYVKEIISSQPEGVRLVLRYAPFHGAVSVEAIEILEAAREQRLFERVLSAFFRNHSAWAGHDLSPDKGKATLWKIALASGLNEQRARTYIAGNNTEKVIAEDLKKIKELNIQGTPTFYVNGKKLVELGPEQLEQMVSTALKENKQSRLLPEVPE